MLWEVSKRKLLLKNKSKGSLNYPEFLKTDVLIIFRMKQQWVSCHALHILSSVLLTFSEENTFRSLILYEIFKALCWKWELCPPKTCCWGAPWPRDYSVLPSQAGSTSCKEPCDGAHDFFHKWPIPARAPSKRKESGHSPSTNKNRTPDSEEGKCLRKSWNCSKAYKSQALRKNSFLTPPSP